MDIEDEISGMIRAIGETRNEDDIFAARQEMYAYRSDALARPNAIRVAFLQVKLRRKIREILGQ